ncbi:MAG: carbohydrate kinase family protein [Anaerolineae bacterium]|nr:carbohydrate kinase family protein [Anaerolineae bacterium]
MAEIVALGDVNVDIIAHFASYPGKGDDALAYSTEIHCGGSAANTAMALSRMGLGVVLISRVGPDSLALKALNSLREAGVIASGLQRDPAAMTGLMYVVVTPDGERTILGHRGANVLTDPEQMREEDIRDAKVLHLSGYALLADPQRSAAFLALEMACRHGLTVTLDPGMSVPQAALDEMRALLPVIDLFLPNLREAQALTGADSPQACFRALLAAGARVVALKLGEHGCLIGGEEGPVYVPGFAVEARDTTGAGDFYAAGMIAGWLGGLDRRSAAVLGNAMGAMAVARVGAGASVPQARDVLALLSDPRQSSGQGRREEAIRQVIDFVRTLATEPEEEGKPWWK